MLFEVDMICMNESTCPWVAVIYLLTYFVAYGICLWKFNFLRIFISFKYEFGIDLKEW